MSMLNKSDFSQMKKEIEKYDSLREEIIKKSRDVLKNSKPVIYSLQRDEITDAKKNMTALEKSLKTVRTIIKKDKTLVKEGTFRIAEQEYVEAICFYKFINNEKIPTHSALGVSSENYLLGMCDLTGELARKAVIYATYSDFDYVDEVRELVDEIYGEIIKLNPRGTSELRKKSDAIKWNLKKIEELMYDVSKTG
ncbi:MAG: hypothetical protein ACLFPQ_01105 [Candidatus Woesearchaeota archaeon]